jgi:hypothetical protein
MFMKVKDASWESVNKFFVAFFLEIWWSIDLICGTCLKYVGIATFLIPFYIPVYRYQVMGLYMDVSCTWYRATVYL